MSYDTPELTRRLAHNAEAVCRHYLSNGRREGRYWLVGDVHNASGRSMYVRLSGPEAGKGAAGRWTDAASGEHGDLLDVIRESCGLTAFRDVADEARRFLGMEHLEPNRHDSGSGHDGRLNSEALAEADDSSDAARRLFSASRSIQGSVAAAYLRRRGITDQALKGTPALRFHPRCFYRVGADTAQGHAIPALIAAVTSLDGAVTGVHRTWLDLLGRDKAAVDSPRRALGHLLGHAVRFGSSAEALAAGEGIETVLSVRCVLPRMPMVAALSSAHLAALIFPAGLRRLYVIRDADPAGDRAVEQLRARAGSAGVEVRVLSPQLGDFNDDLVKLGMARVRATVMEQLVSGDAVRFLESSKRWRDGAKGGGS